MAWLGYFEEIPDPPRGGGGGNDDMPKGIVYFIIGAIAVVWLVTKCVGG